MRKFFLSLLISTYSLFGQALSLNTVSAFPGNTATLTLSFDSQGNAVLPAGMQWTLNYPAGVITGVLFTPGAALTAASKTITPCATQPSGDTICLQVGMNQNPISSGVIATLAFTTSIAAGPNQTIPIKIINQLGVDPTGAAYAIADGSGGITVLVPPPCAPFTLTRTPVGPVLVYQNGLLQTSPGDYTLTYLTKGKYMPTITPAEYWSQQESATVVYTRAVPLSFTVSGQTVTYWGYTLNREDWSCVTGKALVIPLKTPTAIKLR
jgi:hypothetical protein